MSRTAIPLALILGLVSTPAAYGQGKRPTPKRVQPRPLGDDEDTPKTKLRQDAKADARGQKLLDGLAFKKEVCKSYQFGVYMGHGKNVGTASLVVKPAKEGSGAAYETVYTFKLSVGAIAFEREETALLDARFSVVSLLVKTTQSDPGGSKRDTSESTKKKNTDWVHVSGRGGGTETTTTTPDEGLLHDGMASLVLLAHAFGSEATSYGVRKVAWKPFYLGGATGDKPLYASVYYDVGKVASVKHRGKTVDAREIKVDHPERFQSGPFQGDSSLVISAKGELLEIRSTKPDMRLVAGTPEEIKKDLALPPQSKEQVAVRAAVTTFMKVMFKMEEADKLDDVVDWAALKDTAAKTDPEAAKMDIESFTKERKAKIHGASSPGKDMDSESLLQLIEAMMKVVLTKDSATVTLGDDGAFKLKKVADTWLIVETPRGM